MPAPSPKRLPRVTEMAHALIKERLGPGDRAIDATVGNGHDTLFLADCVGKKGEVIGFDLQPEAIRSTRQRLGSCDHVVLHEKGHELLASHTGGLVHAITFNLGYLPGGDKSIITQPDTTLKALVASLECLDPRGLLTVVAYPGHTGGD
ncbi:MAG: class I SAM-dependent methyltransferase, partial [Verrucomicrobiota bacterium]